MGKKKKKKKKVFFLTAAPEMAVFWHENECMRKTIGILQI